jgi:hypothetical protein
VCEGVGWIRMNKNEDQCRSVYEHSDETLDSFKGDKLGGLPSDYQVLRNYSDYSFRYNEV